MKIIASRVVRVGGSAVGPVGTARAPVAAREGVFVVLTAEGGLEGIGEASPLPGYSPDRLEDAVRALDPIHRALAALRTDRPAAEAIARALSPARGELACSPSARFALESALLDLLGRFYRLPAHRLLGGKPGAAVPLSVLLPGPCDPSSLLLAKDALARGVHAFKLKLGARPFEQELAALVGLREGLGPDVELRLDANGGLGARVGGPGARDGGLGARDAGPAAGDLERARERLACLAAVRPACVEEPVGGAALLALLDCETAAPLPAAVRLPIAADESLADPALAAKLLAHPALGAVVLKPAVLGLLRARTIALAAQRRGLPVSITHLFDGPVALSACAELALSIPGVAPCGLAPHAGLAAYPVIPVAQVAAATIIPSPRPGLGLPDAGEEATAWRA